MAALNFLAMLGLAKAQKVDTSVLSKHARWYYTRLIKLKVKPPEAVAAALYFEAQMAKSLDGRYYCATKTGHAWQFTKALISAQIRRSRKDIDFLVKYKQCFKLPKNHNYRFRVYDLLKIDGRIVAIARNVDCSTTGIALLPILYIPAK